ncbi:MAG: hypothetical protein M3077_07495 [Candidatus Dormibacteraeota bacterium]|nr:hypothetical protein [Candidatus Dormibacteraeota bacterium]
MSESLEQLRRLKNTVMGAANRLSLVGRSGELTPEALRELTAVSAELAQAAMRLERLLQRLRQDP